MTDRVNRRRAALAIVAGVALVATSVAQADIDAARQALSQQHYSQAMKALDAVLANKPNDPEARFLKGLTLAREKQPDQAIALFQKLSEDYPQMAEAWNNLGVLYARQNELPQAKQALEKAVDLDANYGPAQENLGDVYVALAQNAYSAAGKAEDDSNGVQKKSAQLADFLKTGTSIGSAARVTRPDVRPEATSATPAASTEPDASSASSKPRQNQSSAASTSQAATEQTPADTSSPEATLKTWAAAWSDQNVDRYLSMYAADFQPSDGRSQSAWKALRRKRLGAPSRIRVDIADVKVDRQGTQARVTFKQHYQSPTYQDHEHKALLMTQTADGWRILHEGAADEVRFAPAQADSAQSDSDDKSSATPKPSSDTPSSSAEPDQAGASDPSAVRADVVSTLQQWAQAWSNQNVQAYLAAYSDNYEPQGGQSLAAWIKQRGQHFKTGEHTKANLSDIQVALDSPGRAIATFNESYQSSSQQSDEKKRVVLVREDGGWRIKKES